MSLPHRRGAKTRQLVLLCTLMACAAPSVLDAQGGGSGGGMVRARSRCGRCASMPDSSRERYEQLLLKIDSLRWEFEHERMSAEKRQQLSKEMGRAVAELQESLGHVAVFTADSPEEQVARAFATTPQGFAYAPVRGGLRGYLGVTFDGPSVELWRGNERIIRFLDHPRISLVEPSSPADRAGVESGDTLLAFNGDDVIDRQISLTKLLVPEKRIIMRVRRDGNERNFRVKIDTSPEYIVSRAMPSMTIMTPPPPGEVRVDFQRPRVTPTPPAIATTPQVYAMPNAVWAWTSSDGIGGAKLESINEGLGKALGVASGVLVLTARQGTPAFESGLREGDVILRASGTPVGSVRQLRAIVEREDGDGIKLTIQREKRQREIVLRW